MKQELKERIAPALYEAFFVVLGVVLALWANEWQNDRADARHARSALASIVEEVRTNQESARQSFEYHQSLVEKIYGSDPDAMSPRDFPRGFISPAQLSDTAWQTAIETDTTNNMPYSTVLLLSRLYGEQERYEDQATAAGQIIYEQLYLEGIAAIVAKSKNLSAVIATFSYREQKLLDTYDKTLQALREAENSKG